MNSSPRGLIFHWLSEKFMFSQDKLALYEWDDSIPFKPINSDDKKIGIKKARKEDLVVIIDYLWRRIKEVSDFKIQPVTC